MTETKKIALVTGANRGIGYETARQLAQKGVVVFLGARQIKDARDAVSKLTREGLQEICALQLDVTETGDRAAAAEKIGQQFGRLDILVNNAAAVPRDATLLDARTIETSEEELRAAFETNLFGVLLLTRDLLPLLKKSASGNIVNVSSTLGSLTLHEKNVPEVAYTKRFSYNASKAALNMFTIHLAQELRDTKIKVNSIHPGWVKTELGTEHAPMEIADGAKNSVETALLGVDGPTGSFFRHGGEIIPW